MNILYTRWMQISLITTNWYSYDRAKKQVHNCQLRNESQKARTHRNNWLTTYKRGEVLIAQPL